MSKKEGQGTSRADREIVVSRLVDAPRDLVWKAFTDPKQIGKWWGPNGFTTTMHEMNVKVGGVWRFIMHGPDGVDYPNKIVYKKIVKPELLFVDHSGGDDSPPEHRFQQTIRFESQGKKTKVTITILLATVAQREASVKFATEGGKQTLGRLEDYLKGRKVS